MPQFDRFGRPIPFMPRHGGLGDLPDTALMERGEYGERLPYGVPPSSNQLAPTGQGETMAPMAWNQSNWQTIPFTVGTEPVRIQEFLLRKFLLIQNTSALGSLFIGFGFQPNATNSLVLGPGLGYEPFVYPINEIWMVSDQANTTGFLIYGT